MGMAAPACSSAAVSTSARGVFTATPMQGVLGWQLPAALCAFGWDPCLLNDHLEMSHVFCCLSPQLGGSVGAIRRLLSSPGTFVDHVKISGMYLTIHITPRATYWCKGFVHLVLTTVL